MVSHRLTHARVCMHRHVYLQLCVTAIMNQAATVGNSGVNDNLNSTSELHCGH